MDIPELIRCLFFLHDLQVAYQNIMITENCFSKQLVND